MEVICLLSKLHAKQTIEVELKMSEMDLTTAESKATYEEIKDYVLEHMGLKVSSLYIAQVKQKCGIIERENYNLPKSENSRQPKCPPEKEAAIREALEHFRMIWFCIFEPSIISLYNERKKDGGDYEGKENSFVFWQRGKKDIAT